MLIRRSRKYRQRLLRRWLLFGLPILFGTVVVFVLLSVVTKVGQPPVVPLLVTKTTDINNQSANVGLPKRLMIPSLNIDAAIEYVGNTSDGSMEISPSMDDVAWYKLGPRPGENGSAVIAGHYGSLNGKFSVFSDLSQLHKGDKLQVEDYKSRVVTFVVRESRLYKPTDDATAVFNAGDDKAHLNLITCEGSWNQAKKSYSDRRIVFTDKM